MFFPCIHNLKIKFLYDFAKELMTDEQIFNAYINVVHHYFIQFNFNELFNRNILLFILILILIYFRNFCSSTIYINCR